MVLPKIDSMGDRLVELPGAALIAVWPCGSWGVHLVSLGLT